MFTFLHLTWRAITALWRIGQVQAPGLARRAWNFYARWTRRFVRLALVAVVGQPLAVILVSLTGVHELTVLMALTPILALLFLMIVASMPRHQDELAVSLAIGTSAAAWEGRPEKEGEKRTKILKAILRGLGFFFLLDMAFGLYFSLLPVENNRGLVLWIVFVGIIFLLAVALQPASRRMAIVNSAVGILLVGSAVAVFVLFPVLLLNGGWGETKSDVAKALKNDAKAAQPTTPTSSTGGSFCVRIQLAGRGNWVGPIGITTHVENEAGFVPGGWKYTVDGPSDARERGSDGQILGIYDPAPLPSGKAEFDGPAGKTITLKVRPPDGTYANC